MLNAHNGTFAFRPQSGEGLHERERAVLPGGRTWPNLESIHSSRCNTKRIHRQRASRWNPRSDQAQRIAGSCLIHEGSQYPARQNFRGVLLPPAEPKASNLNARPNAVCSTSLLCPPSAIRIPNSRSPLLTEDAAIPKMPVIDGLAPIGPSAPRASVALREGNKADSS